MSLRHFLVPALAASLLLACGTEVKDPTTPNTQKPEDQLAPEFEGGGQQANVGEAVYPGPYGVGVGSVIANYKFFGFPDASQQKETPVIIHLADFHNPTGNDVYPEGSPFGAGEPKPRAILLDRSAVWCGPCQIEAEDIIPVKRAAYHPKGEFFVTLDDGPKPGTLATQKDLTSWVTYFDVNYPAVIDPHSTLSAIVGRDAYPGNVIIRTRDMRIIKWAAGTPPPSFWQTFEAVMNDEPVLPGE